MKYILLGLIVSATMISHALSTTEAHELVKTALKNLEVKSEKTYCVKNTETCRIMVQLKDKTTGQTSDVFYDTFYSKERNVGSTCYFIPTAQGHLVVTDLYAQATPQPEALNPEGIDIISPNLAEIVASHDLENVMFYNLKMPKLGTTQYVLAKMIQSEELVYIEGVQYDSNDPKVKQPVRVDYVRVK